MFPHLKIRSLLQLQKLLEQDPDPEFVGKMKEDPLGVIREITEVPNEDEFKGVSVQSVTQLREALEKEPRLVDMLMHDPLSFFQKMIKEEPPPQYKIYRILVGSLCGVIILIISGVLYAWLTKNAREAPTLITAVACTTLGILAGIFVNVPGKNYSGKRRSTPQEDN